MTDDLIADWVRECCEGCGHHPAHHPSVGGMAMPCQWQGCGCPRFIMPRPPENADGFEGGFEPSDSPQKTEMDHG